MDFVTNLQPAEQIVPAIGPFNHPSPGLEPRILFSFLLLLPTRFDMRDVSTTLRRPTQRWIVVALVATQMLARLLLGRWTRDDDGVEGGTELLHVMGVGPRQGNRQRDAVRVREEMALGPQFASIGRVFSDLIPPFTGAETITPSRDWKRQSMPWRSS